MQRIALNSNAPIGVFDSGIGGLSILQAIHTELPHENLLYFADQARVPYGPRTLEEVRSFSEDITRYLLSHNAKLIVVACNTASAAALHHLRERFPTVPFVGMEPAIKPAAKASQNGIVGVLATQATFQGELFANLVDRYAQDVEILPRVCRSWVNVVETGNAKTATATQEVRRHINPVLAQGADTLVLGCTHYPFLKDKIQEVAGGKVTIIDPSPAIARQTRRMLAKHALLRKNGAPQIDIITSGTLAQLKASLSGLTLPMLDNNKDFLKVGRRE